MQKGRGLFAKPGRRRAKGTMAWAPMARFNASPFSAKVPLTGTAREPWEVLARAVERNVEIRLPSDVVQVIIRGRLQAGTPERRRAPQSPMTTSNQSSRAGTWLLTGAALVLVYFLTAPIAGIAAGNRNKARVGKGYFDVSQADLVEMAAIGYATPYHSLRKRITPLESLMTTYSVWWYDRLNPRVLLHERHSSPVIPRWPLAPHGSVARYGVLPQRADRLVHGVWSISFARKAIISI